MARLINQSTKNIKEQKKITHKRESEDLRGSTVCKRPRWREEKSTKKSTRWTETHTKESKKIYVVWQFAHIQSRKGEEKSTIRNKDFNTQPLNALSQIITYLLLQT